MNHTYDCTVRDAAAEARMNSKRFCARYQDTLLKCPMFFVQCVSAKLEYVSVRLHMTTDNF